MSAFTSSAGGGNDVLLYRTVRHCRDYKGGYNRFLSHAETLKECSYAAFAGDSEQR